MSHFTKMEVNFGCKNESELVAALESVFGKGNVDVHEEGSALYGYHGDNRANLSSSNPNYAPPCHIVIRRKHLNASANDIGYRRNENGTYDAYISEYDQGYTFPKEKQNKVAQEYTAKVTEKKLKLQGYSIKRVPQKNGGVQLIASKYG